MTTEQSVIFSYIVSLVALYISISIYVSAVDKKQKKIWMNPLIIVTGFIPGIIGTSVCVYLSVSTKIPAYTVAATAWVILLLGVVQILKSLRNMEK